MNLYYSRLGRILDERTPYRQEGYYVLCEGDEAKFSSSAPEGVVITEEDFVEALAEGCRTVIRDFAGGPENAEVYAFNLYADEHHSFYLYINTMPRFRETLERYQTRYPGKYHVFAYINSLQYNPGDFSFQFWQEHMGEQGSVIHDFEKLAYAVTNTDEADPLGPDDEAVVAFEAGIIPCGYQLMALEAVRRLIGEDAFAPLSKTEDFIAYASTGNDYIDYSLTMRKTIDPDLFYRIFPDIKQKDQMYQAELERKASWSVEQALDEHWTDRGYRFSNPNHYIKSEYDLLKELERFGPPLAEECLRRLAAFRYGDGELERLDYENIYYYVEALHYAGALAPEHQAACGRIAGLMAHDEALKEAASELAALAQ